MTEEPCEQVGLGRLAGLHVADGQLPKRIENETVRLVLARKRAPSKEGERILWLFPKSEASSSVFEKV
jgi:hypothetical protein